MSARAAAPGAPVHTVLIATALIAAACAGEPADDRSGVETRDSAGIDVVVTHRPDAAPLWTLGAEPTLTIGVLEGDEAQELDGVRNPVRLPDGRIVLADAGSGEVRIYDAGGRILTRAGGEGEGPGEFRSMRWLRPYRGDSVAVYDGRLGRVTILAVDGGFGRVIRFGGRAGVAAAREVASGRVERVRPVAVFGDGGFLARVSEVSASSRDTTALRRDAIPYARLDSDGRRVATVDTFPDDETFVYTTSGSVSVRPRAFGRATFTVVRGDRIYVADNRAFQVNVLDADGRALRIARAALEPAPVDEDARARWTEDELAGLTSTFLRRVMEDAIRAMPFPDSMPYHGPLVVGPDGETWLARYSPDETSPTRWIVFAPDGRVRARVETPPRFRLSQVGRDHLLGIERDELDVERVVAYPLGR